jgi:hypothetical protein
MHLYYETPSSIMREYFYGVQRFLPLLLRESERRVMERKQVQFIY